MKFIYSCISNMGCMLNKHILSPTKSLCNLVRAAACLDFMSASRVFQQGKVFCARGRILNTYLELFRDGIMCLRGDINTMTH